MSWSYTPGGSTNLDEIRLLIGDTVSTAKESERLEDEEINRFLAREGSVTRAALASARALHAKIARRATDRTIGSTRLIWAQRAGALRDLIADLSTAAPVLATPFVGGTSVADRAATEANTDRVRPAFAVGMLDSSRE